MPTKSEKEEVAANSEELTRSKTNYQTFAESDKQVIPVVGLGASAGGLEALNAFFTAVQEDSAIAYVVISHMKPGQPTLLPELLQSVTPLPVSLIESGMEIEPHRIYIHPPSPLYTIINNHFETADIDEVPHYHLIDFFFKQLAAQKGEYTAAIILSGTGTDGSQGIVEIHNQGGVTIAQSPESAQHDGMPGSAIKTGFVDKIMIPGDMPETLATFFNQKTESDRDVDNLSSTGDSQWLNTLFVLLRTKIGHDFSGYKQNTLFRRIGRRMNLKRITRHDEYIQLLESDHQEVQALFQELLIGVTSFFRDPESYAALVENALPPLIAQLEEGDTFRAWIPGCSTGEEAYSLAIVLHELLERHNKRISFQLFGTDIDKRAIEKAREGFFPESITEDVSPERLRIYFRKEAGFYRISKEIRDKIVFSVQDILQDPPFSRLHLLCCRNLLIYLSTDAQRKIIPLFHYTLIMDGVMMLGSSETVGGFGNLFSIVDKRWKIYKKKTIPMALREKVEFPSGPAHLESPTKTSKWSEKKIDIGNMVRTVVLENFSPTALLIASNGDIIHIQGRTGKYLESTSGPPSQNILDLAREGIRIELATAIRTVKNTHKPVTRKKVQLHTEHDTTFIDLHVIPQHSPKEIAGKYLVVFNDIESVLEKSENDQNWRFEDQHEADQIKLMEKELQSTRENLQTTIEELESSNEELKSTNEELQSSNEELQSTNEELESSKEELQSLNEELQTVNSELEGKLAELTAAHDDMRNLLDSIEIPTIFVDMQMRVRRFTPEATTIVNLIQTDIGRPLQHVVTNLTYKSVAEDLKEVIKKLVTQEREVQTTRGSWYKMRIMPYRTTDNRIDGAVLTFVSIDAQKEAQHILDHSNIEIKDAWELTRNVFDMNSDPLLVITDETTVVIANSAFLDIIERDESEIFGVPTIDILGTEKKTRTFWKSLTERLKTGDTSGISGTHISLGMTPKTYTIEVRGPLESGLNSRYLLRFIES